MRVTKEDDRTIELARDASKFEGLGSMAQRSVNAQVPGSVSNFISYSLILCTSLLEDFFEMGRALHVDRQ